VGNDVIGKKFEGHAHVLVSVEGCFEVHVFDIGTTKFGAWGANHTVPHNFCRYHVGCLGGELIWIINKVPTDSDSDLVRVILLGVVVDNNLCVSYSSIFGNAPDFVMGKIENCVGTNSDICLGQGNIALLTWQGPTSLLNWGCP
jgi:hypothetical protein